MPKRTVLLASSAAAALVSTACIGPDFHRPPPPRAARYAVQPLPERTAGTTELPGGDVQHFDVSSDISGRWWTLFESSQLNALIELAFRNNPSIPNAVAALKQAQELVYAQQGFFYPSVDLSYSFERQKVAGNLAASVAPGVQGNGTVINPVQNPNGPVYNSPLYYNFHTAMATVSYNPDIFGNNRRQVESLDAQRDAQRFSLEAAYMSLASNVISAVIQEASVRDQIDAVHTILEDNRKALDIVRRQLADGYVMSADLAIQEAQVAQAEALLPPLEKTLEQTRDLIRALVGKMPGEDVGDSFSFADLKMPRELPLTVPSKLIDQRPDVRMAEALLHSANADVGVAISNRLPVFNITGTVGGGATVFNEMFAPGGSFWTLIAGVTQPIFDGGTLRHRQHAAEQALIQAATQYQSTVIGAYQNVADTLHAIVSDADGLNAAVRNEKATKVQLEVARRQRSQGLVGELALLQAEEAYQQAVVSRIQGQATRFGDSASLFMALGGGWWNRPAKLSAN